MSKVLTVGELKAQLEGIDDGMAVYAYSLSADESYPIILVDPTISDRLELNFKDDEWQTLKEIIDERSK